MLPAEIHCATLNAPCGEEILSPSEKAIYDTLRGETRRKDFATGRACAHAALQEIGQECLAVGCGREGEPLWPQDVVGSITHCSDFWAAAVAPASKFLALGIDAERTNAMTREVADIVCTPAERRLLKSVENSLYLPLLTLLFSAKESAYKCVFPQYEQFLEFHDVEIEILPSSHLRAHISLQKATPLQTFTLPGHYAMAGDLILTAVYSPAASPFA